MLVLGINGLGRIGRSVFRKAVDRGFQVGLVNYLGTPENACHVLTFDSTHGTWDQKIDFDDKHLFVGGQKIALTCSTDISNLKWGDYGVNVVMECTGVFKTKTQCQSHLQNGAKKVIVSAPSSDIDGTFVMGVNHKTYNSSVHHVVSNASCTTNCLAPLALVLHNKFGISKGFMTTIHSYTLDQVLLDGSHKDLRRARAAPYSIIPTSTGAASAVGLVLPQLSGKLTGLSLRVPTANVSLVDLVFESQKDISTASINEALQMASTEGDLKGILSCESRPLVSCDFNGSPFSSIIDMTLTQVLDSRMGKIFSWYDNELGFTHRMLDLAKHMESSDL